MSFRRPTFAQLRRNVEDGLNKGLYGKQFAHQQMLIIEKHENAPNGNDRGYVRALQRNWILTLILALAPVVLGVAALAVLGESFNSTFLMIGWAGMVVFIVGPFPTSRAVQEQERCYAAMAEMLREVLESSGDRGGDPAALESAVRRRRRDNLIATIARKLAMLAFMSACLYCAWRIYQTF